MAGTFDGFKNQPGLGNDRGNTFEGATAWQRWPSVRIAVVGVGQGAPASPGRAQRAAVTGAAIRY
jgi:hypothetical protein